MSNKSTSLLSQCLKAHLERLVVLREYRKNIDDPYVTSALSFTIEDTQEAIARVSSRLRQLGEITPMRVSEETTEKLHKQSRSRRNLADKIRFIYNGLVHQQEWYGTHLKELVKDPDSQAILVALAEQNRLRLERWENLMDEMKVSPNG